MWSDYSGHEDKAKAAEARGDYESAYRHWINAKGASIGHTRRERYEKRADFCEKKLREQNHG